MRAPPLLGLNQSGPGRFFPGKNTFTAAHLLQQRAWLLHWSLFIFFNHRDVSGWQPQ
jgi:hypothetical protein